MSTTLVAPAPPSTPASLPPPSLPPPDVWSQAVAIAARHGTTPSTSLLTGVVRVYYNTAWVNGADLVHYLTDVPLQVTRPEAAAAAGAVRLQSGGVVAADRADAASPSPLLTPEERVRARKRVTASWEWVHSVGPVYARTRLTVPRCLVVLTAPVPQFDDARLDPRLFVLAETDPRVQRERARAQERGRRSAIVPLKGNGGHWFDAGAFRTSCAEDLTLLLLAFDAEVAAMNAAAAAVAHSLGRPYTPHQGMLKLPALGLNPHIKLQDGTPIGRALFGPFLFGLKDALASRPAWPNLAVVELPDFTGVGAFTPRWDVGTAPVRVVTTQARDVLDFTDAELASFVCGVAVPTTTFNAPGLGATPTSLESTVGDNSTLRQTCWYTTNPTLLDPRNHVGVDVRSVLSVPHWWPPAPWNPAPPLLPPQSRLPSNTQQQHHRQQHQQQPRRRRLQ